jgi:intracellular sulfur oxidation DsrE/DsrF family protein
VVFFEEVTMSELQYITKATMAAGIALLVATTPSVAQDAERTLKPKPRVTTQTHVVTKPAKYAAAQKKKSPALALAAAAPPEEKEHHLKARIETLALSTPEISYKACGNTQENMRKAENRDIPIIPQAEVVKSGVIHIMQLEEHGWSYVKP